MSVPNVDAPQDTPTPAAPATPVNAVTPKSEPVESPADEEGYVSGLPENVVVSPDKDDAK